MGVIRFTGNKLDPASINALVKETLVQGQATSKWWRRQSSDFLDQFMGTVRTSMNNGESLTQAISRVAGGTVDGVTVPGILKTTKNKAGALVATATNAVSNRAALLTFQQNGDVIKWVTQVSTLDNKTSDICISYSGQTWDVMSLQPVNGATLPFNGGPPRHFNCRSRLRPVTKSFRDLGIDSDEIPASTRASMDGQVPADITFSQWLKTKDATFQNKLLGPGRAKLWRNNDITLTQLVDMRGNPMTLRQLETKVGIKKAPIPRPPPKPKMVESFIEDTLITEAERTELETLGKQAYQKAKAADPIVTRQIVKMADDVGASFPKAAAPGAEQVIDGSLTFYRLKDSVSSARKIQTYAAKFEITNAQAAARLSDSLRYTFLIDDANYVDGIRRTMEEFARLGYKNGKFDPAWLTRPDYKGVNINMITPQGVKIELQFHTPNSFNVKQNINHGIYEQFRTLPKARQLGEEGKALQAQLLENSANVPVPRGIALLDDIKLKYDSPTPEAQRKLVRDAKRNKEIRDAEIKREAEKAKAAALRKERRAAREKKALEDQKKIEEAIAAKNSKAVKSALEGKFEKVGETQAVIDLHVDAYAKAPTYMKSAIGQRRALKGVVTDYDLKKNGGAFYRHRANEIWMSEKSHPNRIGRNATWRHEYGHAIDYDLAERYYKLAEVTPSTAKGGAPIISARFNKSLLADSRKFQKWKPTVQASAKYDELVLAHRGNLLNEIGASGQNYYNPLLKKHGMTYDQIRQLAKNNFNLQPTSELTKFVDEIFLPNMLASLETGNVQGFLNVATQHIWKGGGDLASMSDYIGSITRNKIRGGWGHSNAYYGARQHGPTGKHKEAFANFFGMLGGEDAEFFESLLRAWGTDKYLDDLIDAMKLLEKG